MRLMLPKLVNIALLGLFPLAWQAPLARAEVSWLFYSEQISILSGVAQLYESDLLLCVVVTLFAIVTPYLKTVALIYVQFSDRDSARDALPLLEVLGRLSMMDVFLIALYVIAIKGLETITIEWGFYLFTALVLLSIWSSWMTHRARFKTVPREEPLDSASISALLRDGAAPRRGDQDGA